MPSVRSLVSASVVALLLGTSVHATPPASIDAAGAQARAVSGVLRVRYEDEFPGHAATLALYLEDESTGRVHRLQLPRAPRAGLASGRRVTVRATPAGESLRLEAADLAQLETQATATPTMLATTSVTGTRRALVMMGSFQDAAAECTVPAVSNLMFDDPNNRSVDDLYRETSQGRVSFTGAVAGPYAVDELSAGRCALDTWAAKLDAKAQAAGVDVASFQHRVYVLPRGTSCPAGVGDLGGTAGQTWVKYCDLPDVYAHELGHNLGMSHASTPTGEYDDYSDVMGISGLALRGVAAPHAEQMGWRTDTQVRAVTGSGYYDVAPMHLAAGTALAPQILKIAKPDTGDWYYLSYRRPVGFDANIASRYFTLNVHTFRGDTNRTFLRGTVAVGQSYVDAANGLTFTLVSKTDDYLTVQVQMPGSGVACVAGSPQLAVTPSSSSATAGGSVQWQIAVTDTDGSACASRTFSLIASAPAGWTSTVTPAQLSLVPAQVGGANAAISVPPGTAAGTYAVTIRAVDVATGQAVATSTGSVVVAAPVPAGDVTAPSVPGGLAASVNAKQLRVSLTWQASVDDVGVAYYRVWRDGVQVAQTASPGYVDAAVVGGASYQYAVSAHDAAGNASARSAAAVATVSRNGGKSR
jgi:hypothetical protein